MFDVFDLEKLFNKWLRVKGSQYQCEIIPKIKDVSKDKAIELDIYIIYSSTSKALIHTIEKNGVGIDNLWEDVRNELFAYFMEVGRNVE